MHAAPIHEAVHSDKEHSVLIVALDAVIPAELPAAEVHVVAPALNSRLRHWFSDDDAARGRAADRLAAVVASLERHGVHAEGHVGDADPMLAIADALTMFHADEIVIAAQLEHSIGIADELATRARGRFALPVFRAGQSLPHAA